LQNPSELNGDNVNVKWEAELQGKKSEYLKAKLMCLKGTTQTKVTDPYRGKKFFKMVYQSRSNPAEHGNGDLLADFCNILSDAESIRGWGDGWTEIHTPELLVLQTSSLKAETAIQNLKRYKVLIKFWQT
jgi:hypothetical protein